jgi:hypothetical protein
LQTFETDTLRAANGFDGGVLEIQIGTNDWADITNAGGTFVANGYNRKIDSRFGNPLTNRWAWSGTNGGFVTTTVNLPSSAQSQNVRFRWRVGTDVSNPGGGWRIDSIAVTAFVCCVADTTASPPPVIQSIILSNTAMSLSWSSVSGRTYRLEYKDDLADTDWNPILPVIQSYSNTTSGSDYYYGNILRFYRVTLLP